jgi:hypothetical protein
MQVTNFYSAKIILLGMRLGQAFALGIIILSFYTKSWWCFAIGRVLHYKFLVGSQQASNHLIRVCESVHQSQTGKYKFFISDKSVNDIIFFTIGSALIHEWTTKASPILLPAWIIFGIQCFSFLLTILLGVKLKSTWVDGHLKFTDMIKSDVPLTKKEFYSHARDQEDEESHELNSEERYRRFLARENHKKRFTGDPDSNYVSGYGNHYGNLENMRYFKCMRFLSILYMLAAGGVNSFIYIYMVVGMNKFKINTRWYEWGLVTIMAVLLKLQPKFMGLAIFGSGV